MRVIGFIFLFFVGSIGAQAQVASAKWKVIEAEGDTLLNREDYAGALKLYDQAIEQSKLAEKEAKALLYKRAICFYSLGAFEKALGDLNVFVPEFPSFPRARLLRAFVNRELGSTDAQLVDINELLTLSPLNPDLMKWKSAIYLETEKYKEATEELSSLQKLVNDEEIETQLGFAYGSLDQPDSAFYHYDKALAMNGGYLPAYIYITTLCLEQEAFDMALLYADLGLKLEPANANLIFYKGVALVEKKNEDEGCKLITRAFYAGVDQAADYLKEYCYSSK